MIVWGRLNQCVPNGKAGTSSKGNYYAVNAKDLEPMLNSLSTTIRSSVYINNPFKTVIETLPLRSYSEKYCFNIDEYNALYQSGTYGSELPTTLKNKSINTSIICSATQPGSLYDRTSISTGGKLFYDHTKFKDELLNHIYGYIPYLRTTFYGILVTGYSMIVLDDELSPNNDADTDSDGIKDWDEVDISLINWSNGSDSWTPDAHAILPTFPECVKIVGDKLFYVEEGLSRFDEWVPTDGGPTIKNTLEGISVLPIKSDPTHEDGDNDGIPDIEEMNWDGVDKRYKKLNPLRKDSLETLYPDLVKFRSHNKSSNVSYLELNGNKMTMNLKIYFSGDAYKDASSSFASSVSSDEVAEETRILNRLGSNYTFKDVIIDGLHERWNLSFKGNTYDFNKYMNIDFEMNIIEQSEIPLFSKYIQINVFDGKCGVSNQSGVNWKVNCTRILNLYTSYCDIDSHENKSAGSCSNYANYHYNIAVYEGTASHENGHMMGLKDMYADAHDNNGFEPKSQSEIIYDESYFGLSRAKGIMMCNGKGVPNDIEMIIRAFEENTWQYYVPRFDSGIIRDTEQKISTAIKEPQIYIEESTGKEYTWDNNKKCFV